MKITVKTVKITVKKQQLRKGNACFTTMKTVDITV